MGKLTDRNDGRLHTATPWGQSLRDVWAYGTFASLPRSGRSGFKGFLRGNGSGVTESGRPAHARKGG